LSSDTPWFPWREIDYAAEDEQCREQGEGYGDGRERHAGAEEAPSRADRRPFAVAPMP